MFVNSISEKCNLKVMTVDGDTDAIILFGREHLQETQQMLELYPHIPLVVFNWDQYGWHLTQDSDWKLYNHFQTISREIFVPSNSVKLRIKEFLGLDHKCHIIKSWARFFDYPRSEIKDGRYIFQVVRPYRDDPQYEWAERACNELKIPIIMNNTHNRSESDFQRCIAESTLLLCHYDEASTGGLTLIEGHRHGKPVMFSDSPYMGANDYFGDRATTFQRHNYEDFKNKLETSFYSPVEHDVDECIEFTNQYQIDNVIKIITERMEFLINERK
jgi:hypothetical protein